MGRGLGGLKAAAGMSVFHNYRAPPGGSLDKLHFTPPRHTPTRLSLRDRICVAPNCTKDFFQQLHIYFTLYCTANGGRETTVQLRGNWTDLQLQHHRSDSHADRLVKSADKRPSPLTSLETRSWMAENKHTVHNRFRWPCLFSFQLRHILFSDDSLKLLEAL